jgi:molecular chaperone GrpE
MDNDKPENNRDSAEPEVEQEDAGRDSDETFPAGGSRADAESVDRKISDVSEDIHQKIMRERDEYLESLQRLQADFANYRKRVLKESQGSTGRAAAEIAEDLLPVLDNFERAMQSAVEHDEKVLSEGVELVYRQLRDVLDRRGLCEIVAEGKDFDPEHHEAVLCQPSDEHEEGKVMNVVEKGYRVDERVIRPAKVIVSDGKKSG